MTESDRHEVRPGDSAPDVTLYDTAGDAVPLRELAPGRWLVLFFYPRDASPVCTMEACRFRDAYAEFVEAGAEVVGVSDDETDSHVLFAAAHQLPYRLLTDRGGAARRVFGTGRAWGLLPGRVTYVVDPNGVVRHAFRAQMRAGRHVQEALAAVRAERPASEEGARP